MLNEDGTPKILYHGADAEFESFDPTMGRANMDIQGMFFSPWEIDTAGYGSKVGAYYVNLKILLTRELRTQSIQSEQYRNIARCGTSVF